MASNGKVTSLKIRKVAGSDSTLLATWECSKDNIDHYEYRWRYWSGNMKNGSRLWIVADDSSTTVKQTTYDIPSNAKAVKIQVKPVAKKQKKKVKGKTKEIAYWTGDWSDWVEYKINYDAPEVPSAPNVSLSNLKLTASVETYDSNTKKIEFDITITDQSGKSFAKITADVHARYAYCEVNVKAGHEYRVHCRAIAADGDTSAWSNYSSSVKTSPGSSSGLTATPLASGTEVELNWTAVSTATSYTIEYSVKKEYFDVSPSNVQSTTVSGTSAIISGLDTGQTWWFRVQAVNESGGSEFCEPVDVILGKSPSAPTTWSLKSTVSTSERAVLYWVHNAEDGSKETYAKIELTINGVTAVKEIQNPQTEGDTTTRSYMLEASEMPQSGGVILWRVQTKGVTPDYGDWSVQREIKVLAPATLSFDENVPSVLSAYPLPGEVTAGPNTQSVLRFFVSIIANEAYEASDFDGNSKWVSEGEEIFSGNYYPKNVGGSYTNSLEISLTPGDVTFESGVDYTLRVSASMDSGMHPEVTADFHVGFGDGALEPDAQIWYNESSYSTSVVPFCMATVDSGLLDSSGNQIKDSSNNDITTLQYDVEAPNVTLAVYRREFDGTFTLIQDNIPGNLRQTIQDPHPALDMARYRIVAIDNVTGVIGYSDLPGYVIDEPAVIIQWDEEWSNYDYSDEDVDEPAWTGSLLRLPYNIDTSENYSPDASLIEYIGRAHPVSYYGTQKGSTATWNMDIPRDDEETLYALRRLSIHPGDVYVREPSGRGYWANVKVSFSSKHCDVIIPVTLNITRVEGGA